MKRGFFYRAFQDQKSRTYFIINDFIAFLIIVSTLAIIIETVAGIWDQYKTFFIVLEIFVASIFTIEYIARIATAEKKLSYILSPLGIIDLLAILPSYFLLISPVFTNSFKVLRVFRIIRIIRLLRIIRLIRIFSLTQERKARVKKARASTPWLNLEIYLISLMSVVVISASLLYLVEGNVLGSPFYNIPQGLWWAIVTVTTVGYGDLIPITVLGKIVASLTMLAGLALFALLLTVVGRFAQILLFGSPIIEPGGITPLEKLRVKIKAKEIPR